MNLIATETGRVLQLLVMEEIFPLSGIYFPNFCQQLGDRYAFVTRPQNYTDAIKSGAKFQHGQLTTPAREILIKEIGVFNDGIIVDCQNTDDAEYVTEDIMEWTRTSFAFREQRTNIRRRFTSVITIEFDGAIETAIGAIETIAKSMSAAYNRAYGERIDVKLLRLSLNADPLSIPPLVNTQFYVERRIQRPYAENRYQSGAPLRTEEHIGLLETIEASLLQKNPIA
jgi:hypothetical protein